MLANGDNFALLPEVAHQKLSLVKAKRIRINSVEDNKVEFEELDSAISSTQNGLLEWRGRTPKWRILPGRSARISAETGVDEYGDYAVYSNGRAYYWTAIDEDGRLLKT